MAKDFTIQEECSIIKLPTPNKTKLLYHINNFTDVYHFYISLLVTLDIVAIDHKEGHLGFT